MRSRLVPQKRYHRKFSRAGLENGNEGFQVPLKRFESFCDVDVNESTGLIETYHTYRG